MEVLDHGINAHLIPTEDSNKLSDAIKQIVQQKDYRDRLGQNALRRLKEKYTLQRMRDGYSQLYQQLLNLNTTERSVTENEVNRSRTAA